MFNRRFLRIKVFQALYAFFQDEEGSRYTHEKNLLKSLEKSSDLYLFLLAFPAEFKFYLSKELDIQTSKHFPIASIITPIKALMNNQAFCQLESNEFLTQRLKSVKAKWVNTEELYKNIFTELRNSELMQEYTARESHTFAEDKKMLGEIYESLIGDSETFNQYIEEQFLNWEDDQVLVTIALLKTIQGLKENDLSDFIEKIDTGDQEDQKFMKDLYHVTIENNEELLKLIADKTKNWEADRIAMVDMLLMKMALCEILKFPHIPVKVSINEYLELAKLYSTPNSHGFINGVLDKIQLDLRSSDRIEKQGRGLVE
jgi:N utilization substance protein B